MHAQTQDFHEALGAEASATSAPEAADDAEASAAAAGPSSPAEGEEDASASGAEEPAHAPSQGSPGAGHADHAAPQSTADELRGRHEAAAVPLAPRLAQLHASELRDEIRTPDNVDPNLASLVQAPPVSSQGARPMHVHRMGIEELGSMPLDHGPAGGDPQQQQGHSLADAARASAGTSLKTTLGELQGQG